MTRDMIGALLIAVLLLYLTRELLTWWFKITHIVSLLEDIAVSLRTLPSVKTHDSIYGRKPRAAA